MKKHPNIVYLIIDQQKASTTSVSADEQDKTLTKHETSKSRNDRVGRCLFIERFLLTLVLSHNLNCALPLSIVFFQVLPFSSRSNLRITIAPQRIRPPRVCPYYRSPLLVALADLTTIGLWNRHSFCTRGFTSMWTSISANDKIPQLINIASG